MKKIKKTVYVTEDISDLLRKLAYEEGKTLGEIMTEALLYYSKKNKNTK